ncbi:MAG: BON domain-containing protein [Bdellovibrionota bacterium]
MKKKSKDETGHTYATDSQESEAAASGAPTPGFNEDSEYAEYERQGLPFGESLEAQDGLLRSELDETTDTDLPDSSATVDPEDQTFGAPDLRFGGEDISGVSEWSMRAKNPELDDGIDAGDFKRPDEEILEDLLVACKEDDVSLEGIEFEVDAAVVTIRGKMSDRKSIEAVELTANSVPGVKTVQNQVELSSQSTAE